MTTVILIIIILIVLAAGIYIFINYQKESVNDEMITSLQNRVAEKTKEVKQTNEKIKKLKTVAEAVKNEKMPDTIDDLLNVFSNIESGL